MRRVKTYFLFSAIILAGCHSRPTNPVQVDQLPDIYPDYIGVTIPVGIAPLNFSMADDKTTTIDVTVKGSVKGMLQANGDDADFDIDEWHQLVSDNQGGQLLVTVCAETEGQWTQYREFPIYVSQDALDEWGITYRRIPPSYEIYSKMGLYQRDLSNFDESALLENSQLIGNCINCHTANRTNPDQYTFHVRGNLGATVICKGQNPPDLLASVNEGIGGGMVYPYWHPNGRYCAFSTNKTAQIFHLSRNKRIEVYDNSSDVFVYDTETKKILRDSLTMTDAWAENCPAFSPDGKFLYFTTAIRQTYPDNFDKERYNLCRVAFDASTGQLGEQVDTLLAADRMEKSVTWPRPSYDGRYVMYTQTDYGYFSVWHPEADLWLMDLKTGESRPLEEVNSSTSESFHNWNTNSRWFLFTSRRDDGLYTRIYFASIDQDGHVTKPFMLPQRHPKVYYRRLLYSYNTPDFTSRRIGVQSRQMSRYIEKGERIKTIIKTNK